MRAILLTWLVTISASLPTGVAAQETVTLNEEDIALLRTIANQEKAANVTGHILAWSPLVQLATAGNLPEFSFTFVSTDFAAHAQSIGNIEKIKACSILQQISLHLIGREPGPTNDFFTALEEKYEPHCQSN